MNIQTQAEFGQQRMKLRVHAQQSKKEYTGKWIIVASGMIDGVHYEANSVYGEYDTEKEAESLSNTIRERNMGCCDFGFIYCTPKERQMDIKTKLHICPNVACDEIAVALEVYIDGKQAWFPPTGKPFWSSDSHELVPEEIVKAVLERPEEMWKPGVFKRQTEVTENASV